MQFVGFLVVAAVDCAVEMCGCVVCGWWVVGMWSILSTLSGKTLTFVYICLQAYTDIYANPQEM